MKFVKLALCFCFITVPVHIVTVAPAHWAIVASSNAESQRVATAAQIEAMKLNAQILEEQVADFQSDLVQLSARKTYEDGVRDGMTNSTNSSYTLGYHAAMSHGNPFVNVVNNEEE
jgi:hypothetical protein